MSLQCNIWYLLWWILNNYFKTSNTTTLNSDSCDYLINRSLSKIKKKRIFDEAIHLVTQWKHSIDPTIDYLNMLGTPVAEIIPQYSTFLLNKGVYHCIKEWNFPKLTAP